MKPKLALTLLVTLITIAAAICVVGFDPDTPVIFLTNGASKVLWIPEVKRIAIGNPDVVEVAVISENEVMLVPHSLDEVSINKTTMHVWAGDNPYPQLYILHITNEYEMFLIDAEKIPGVFEVKLELLPEGEIMVCGFVRDEEARTKVLNLARIWWHTQVINGLLLPGEQPPLTTGMLEGILTISDSQVVTKLFSPRSRSATELETVISNMTSESGQIIIDETTNTLIVIDLPGNVDTIGKFIERLDEQTQHQVMIETKFVELSEAATEELGVNWLLQTTSWRGAWADGQFAADPSRSHTDGGITVGFNSATGNFKDLAITNLSATLTALEKEGKLNLLSSPRVTTINGMQATVEITSSQAYISGYNFTYDDNGDITSVTPNVETVDYGITLDVTPVIGRDDIVSMAVTPTVRLLQDFATAGEPVAIFMRWGDIRDNVYQAAQAPLSLLYDGEPLEYWGLVGPIAGTFNVSDPTMWDDYHDPHYVLWWWVIPDPQPGEHEIIILGGEHIPIDSVYNVGFEPKPCIFIVH